MLVNGLPAHLISIRDRGLLYGDGVFRTLRLSSGKVQHWPLHYQKLQQDCQALLIPCPEESLLLSELELLLAQYANGVLKLIITRGEGQRGYALPEPVQPSRIWDYAVLPSFPAVWYQQGIQLTLSSIRLAHQPRLAGIKHLNRLENVLAAAELCSPEALLLDEDGLVIEGTRTNIFLVKNNTLITPELNKCGVAGVQRSRVIAWARQQNISVFIRPVRLEEVEQADAVFVVNSVIGVWPVAAFQQCHWHDFGFVANMAQQLMES